MPFFKPWRDRIFDAFGRLVLEKFASLKDASFAGAVVADKGGEGAEFDSAAVLDSLENADADRGEFHGRKLCWFQFKDFVVKADTPKNDGVESLVTGKRLTVGASSYCGR